MGRHPAGVVTLFTVENMTNMEDRVSDERLGALRDAYDGGPKRAAAPDVPNYGPEHMFKKPAPPLPPESVADMMKRHGLLGPGEEEMLAHLDRETGKRVAEEPEPTFMGQPLPYKRNLEKEPEPFLTNEEPGEKTRPYAEYAAERERIERSIFAAPPQQPEEYGITRLQAVANHGHDGRDATASELFREVCHNRNSMRRRMAVEIARRRLAEQQPPGEPSLVGRYVQIIAGKFSGWRGEIKANPEPGLFHVSVPRVASLIRVQAKEIRLDEGHWLSARPAPKPGNMQHLERKIERQRAQLRLMQAKIDVSKVEPATKWPKEMHLDERRVPWYEIEIGKALCYMVPKLRLEYLQAEDRPLRAALLDIVRGGSDEIDTVRKAALALLGEPSC